MQFAILLVALTHFSSATMLLGKQNNIFNVFKVIGAYSNANDLDFKVTPLYSLLTEETTTMAVMQHQRTCLTLTALRVKLVQIHAKMACVVNRK